MGKSPGHRLVGLWLAACVTAGCGLTDTDGEAGDDDAAASSGGTFAAPLDPTGGAGGFAAGGGPPEAPLDCKKSNSSFPAGHPLAGEPCWDLAACHPQEVPHFLESCSGHCLGAFDNQRIEGFTSEDDLPPLPVEEAP